MKKPPKPKAVKAPDLDSFGVLPTDSPTKRVLRLTDINGKIGLFALGPEGLADVLDELLFLASQWGEFTPQIQLVSGPQKALPASHISITKAREPTEAAVTMHVGPMQLVFLLPVAALLPELARVARQIGRLPEAPQVQ